MKVNSSQPPIQDSINKTPNSYLDANQRERELSNSFPLEYSPQLLFELTENNNTKVTLSPQALSLQNNLSNLNHKNYQQDVKDFEVAQKQYQERVSKLPVDYRKMKMVKDGINEEIKALKAELARIEQSITINEEAEQKILDLKQQIVTKRSMVIEIDKEFNQKLEEQKRLKRISPVQATEIQETFNATPPEPPKERLLRFNQTDSPSNGI